MSPWLNGQTVETDIESYRKRDSCYEVAGHLVKLLSEITWDIDYKPNRFIPLEDEV